MNVQVRLPGTEHWTSKGEVKLFMWNKVVDPAKTRGTILFVHGSSMASQPTFDLEVPGRPDSSAMEYFAKQGYDCWCVRHYGVAMAAPPSDRATTRRSASAPTTASRRRPHISCAGRARRWPTAFVGCAAGSFAERPPKWSIALRSTPRCDRRGARRFAERRKKLPEFIFQEPPPDRPRLRAFDLQPRSSGTAETSVINAFADAIVKLDDPCRPAPMWTCAPSRR